MTFSGGMTGGAHDDFIEQNGKLLLDHSTAHVEQPGGLVMDVQLHIKYQTVQSVIFPSEIAQTSEMAVNGAKQQVQFDIFLKDCTVQ